MKFTEDDIPLMKLIFNPSTHDMGMLVGGERAEEIFEYVCDEIEYNKTIFFNPTSDFFEKILINEKLCNFFWDNNILQLSLLEPHDIAYILKSSPIAEKILDSGKLDLAKLNTTNIYWVLEESPIAEKIWDYGKLDLTKLDGDYIYWILRFSPIAKKIWDSGKLNLSLLHKSDLEELKQKFG